MIFIIIFLLNYAKLINCIITDINLIQLSLLLYQFSYIARKFSSTSMKSQFPCKVQTKLEDLPIRKVSDPRVSSIKITSNHYHVRIGDIEKIYIYSIKFTPNIAYDNKALRNHLLELAMPQIRQNIVQPVLSGMNIFSLVQPLKSEFNVNVKEYIIAIKEVKELNVKQYPNILLQFLNNGLRNIMERLNFMEIGKSRSFFNTKTHQTIDNLMLFKGFKANFMQLEKRICLRVNTANKIVRNMTVLQYINEIYNIHAQKQREERRQIVKNELIGKTVMANYGKTRYYRIQEVVFNTVEQTMCVESNMSIKDYFKAKYSLQIKNLKQPLIKIQNKKGEGTLYIIPQLCLMTGIPQNFDQMRRKKLSQATIKSASQKKRQIQVLIDELKKSNQIDTLKKLNLDISVKMQQVQAKLIQNPSLLLGCGHKIEPGRQSNFNLFNKPIYSAKHKVKVCIIYFSGSDVNYLTKTFKSTAQNLQAKVDVQTLKAGQYDHRKAVSIIQRLIEKAVKDEQANIIFAILPNQMKKSYPKIKISSLIDNKVSCQIALQSLLKKKNFQTIATKLLLQILVKRGNVLWVPEPQKAFQKSMIVAMDYGKNSASVCAALNNSCSSYYSKSSEYKSNTDKFLALITLLLSSVHAYFKRNKHYPNSIIILHNSCSQSQLQLYKEFFIQPSKQKLAQISGIQGQINLIFVMINTKTNERFFSNLNGQIKNVPAGTLVDQKLVESQNDFFIISQFANRGCTLPNHYSIAYADQLNQQAKIQLQIFLFSQCFNYANWTGSIKIPGVLQYAKKCSRFNSDALDNNEVPQDLKSKLYFI